MFKSLLLIGLFCLAGVSKAELKKEDVKKISLKNGMTIYVVEDHSIPNANMYLFWKVGSRNEYPGITGLAHFFEHMMFNGAKKYGTKQFDRVMEANGGANNAYTTSDLTVYTNWFPADSLEVMFDLEADRIHHLSIDAKMVESERGVVISERSTSLENSNFSNLYDHMTATAFSAHPYNIPVIGHLSDIENWSIEDLRTFHKTYYAPNNAVVVISGAVKYDEVKRLAKKYFEPIPAQKEPRKIHTVEPEQKGEKTVYVYKESVTSPYVMMTFHVPEAKHKDFHALSFLSTILGSGKSSRLYKELVEKQQIATDVGSFVDEGFDPSLFFVYGVATSNENIEKLRTGMIKEINRIMKDGVDSKELEKVRNKSVMEFHTKMSTINGKSNTLGSYELFYGGYEKVFTALDDMKKITPQEIQKMAQSYLRKANRTVGILASEKDTKDEDK